MEKAARFLPPRVTCAVVRAAMNAVCTSTRFGAIAPRACPFCLAPACDNLSHFASCTSIVTIINSVSHNPPSRWNDTRDLRIFLTIDAQNLREFTYHALVLDITLAGYNNLIHENIHSEAAFLDLATGRIRNWAVYSARMRNIVRELFKI